MAIEGGVGGVGGGGGGSSTGTPILFAYCASSIKKGLLDLSNLPSFL